ncbi:hypothetical protein [Polaromonas sp. A23]|uniref:hypothetical protein n=1 Tax=Polaromonas sp. A23 TaxID=1944133 RepID=UPI0009C5A724|nr:hypothetical protein [Polaromonas sp. A23]OOG45380.1 hypothetical protein B0B52_04165 [Polaromonas sp. A23]
MNRLMSLVFSLMACVFLFGCAHPITMNPDLAVVAAPAGVKPINKKVGYHMPDVLRAVEVTTPGGGGDKVRYFPYRDIEPGFYKALSEAFTGVSKVQNPKDAAALQADGISLLITPEITTNSSSDGAFTWPPTQFTVRLVCAIVDANGKPVETIRVSGEGAATFGEFKSNFSLAAVRASNDALVKLIKALGESPALRK